MKRSDQYNPRVLDIEWREDVGWISIPRMGLGRHLIFCNNVLHQINGVQVTVCTVPRMDKFGYRRQRFHE